jgi:cell division protein FtsB
MKQKLGIVVFRKHALPERRQSERKRAQSLRERETEIETEMALLNPKP